MDPKPLGRVFADAGFNKLCNLNNAVTNIGFAFASYHKLYRLMKRHFELRFIAHDYHRQERASRFNREPYSPLRGHGVMSEKRNRESRIKFLII